MNRKIVFEAVDKLVPGIWNRPGAIAAMDDAIDAALGIIVVRAPKPKGRQINAAGERLIKSFEGLELTAYPDPGTGGKPWTIGYGATEDENGKPFAPGTTITQERADALFDKDTDRFEAAVERLAPVATDNQFAAMVSLAFNVGTGNFEKSTLLKKHNAGDYEGAAAQFGRWNRAAGRVMKGLTRRRAAEAALYRSGT
ncbi:lysozyme [Qipengyuania sp. MTN3-11]|uniref:lysozyme n=1 Tax=Qipengyuania sp. MTN3-11 TaxID=3056557 RepID=UPI0036F1D928